MSQNVEMIFYDVQHGNATYIKTPNEKHLMIDLGIGDYSGKNEKFSPLAELRNKYKIQQLDHVTITHPHLDHIDDILNFDAFSPQSFLTPKYLTDEEVLKGTRVGDKPKFDEYLKIRNKYCEPSIGTSHDTSVPDNFGGVLIQRFSTSNLPHDNFNNHSIITVISYSGIKIVMPGDNEKASFDELMKSEDFKNAVENANILLAPHHGRQSAYHSDFIKLVNPWLTIVSDGSLCDTSANHHYSSNSSGWTVFKFDGSSEIRKCLTTNSDGEVYVSFGNYLKDGKQTNFLNVKIQ
ncbi:MAG TPA: MBL fold metallo-hydrolase [Sphingobacteriaceae bacterium]|nr:MBL fold metallo-hydrolase [Sphingobacteriaceae bacterium]